MQTDNIPSHGSLWPDDGALGAEELALIQPVETNLPQRTGESLQRILQADAGVDSVAVVTENGDLYQYHPRHVMSVEIVLDRAAVGAAHVCPTQPWVLLSCPDNPDHQVACVAVGAHHGVGVLRNGRAFGYGWDGYGQSGGGLGPLGDVNGTPVRGLADGPPPLREVWNRDENCSYFLNSSGGPLHIVSVSLQ